MRNLLLVLLLLPVPSLATAASLHWWPGSPLGQTLYLLGKAWIVGLPLWWWWTHRRDEKPLVPTRRGDWSLAIGSGLVIGALVGLVMWATADVLYDRQSASEQLVRIGLDDPARFLVFAAAICLINSLVEEFVWRWFVVGRLAAAVPPSWAIILGGIAFGIHHVVALAAYAPWSSALLAGVAVSIGGCIWSWLYLRSGHVWGAWISHLLVDVGIFVSVWFTLMPA